MCAQDNNVKRTTENPVAIAAPASVFGGKNLGAPGNVEEDHEEATPLSEDAMNIYEHLIGVHAAYFRACNVPYMTTSRSQPQLVVQEQNTHRAYDALCPVLRLFNNKEFLMLAPLMSSSIMELVD
jgi:hypothetical protein